MGFWTLNIYLKTNFEIFRVKILGKKVEIWEKSHYVIESPNTDLKRWKPEIKRKKIRYLSQNSELKSKNCAIQSKERLI